MKRALLAVAAVAAAPTTAAADPLDESGLGEAAAAMANARTAIATGPEAAHTNPAGVARIGSAEALIGYQYADNHLDLDGRDSGVTATRGTAMGLAAPLGTVRGVQLALGTAFYLPDQYLARLQLFPTNEPEYVRLGAAQQRIVVDTVAAARWKDLAIGAGVSMLTNAKSRDLTFDVGVKSGEKVGAAHLDIDLPTRMAPLVGVSWKPNRYAELGAMFRGKLELDLAIDIVANVDVPNVVSGDAKIALRTVTNFTPMRAAIGGALHPVEGLTLSADVAYDRWSALGSGIPDLQVLVELSLAPPLIASTAPAAHFKDTITSRLGAEWLVAGMRVRGGVAYLPSPVPKQTGLTSFADGNRVLATLGAGVRVPARWLVAQPIDLDFGLGYQHVMRQIVEKDPAIDPGGSFSSGGNIYSMGASATVRFK